MTIVLNQEKVQQINLILNEMPIREINRVKAILAILNESTQTEDESNTED